MRDNASAKEAAGETEQVWHGNLLEMSTRIERMEALLSASGLAITQPSSPVASSIEQDELSERFSTLIVDDKAGLSHFWGFFGSLNPVIPLLDQASFMKLYEQQYSINPPRGASWYATLNIVFAIGSLAATVGQRGSTPETALNDEADRWNFTDYFRNSCCVLAELMFESHNVLAVQALIGISFILESTMDVQATFTVIGAAVRIAHTIGLHRKILRPENYGLSVAESNQRRNTFWTLYIIEKSLAIRLGRPSVISDDDIDVPLPEYGDNFDPSQDVDDKLDTFYHQVMLSRIESRIHTQLYSVHSQRRPVGDRLRVIAQLDEELRQWRDDLPLKLRPGEPITCYDSQIAQVIMLHFVYYNCMTTVHRAPAHVALWTMKPSSSDELKRTKAAVHHRVSASHLHCIDAARNTAQLLSHFDRQDMIPKGVLLHLVVFYPLSAFLTLFANILENPNDSYVDSDVGLMNMIEKFLSQAAEERFETPRVMVKRVFAKLTSITAKFLARNASRSRPVKRGHEDLTNEPSKSEPISSNTDPILKQNIDEALQPLNFSHMDYVPYNDSDVLSYDPFDPSNTFEFTPDRLDFSIPTLSSPFISLDPRDFDWDQLMFTGSDQSNYFQAP
ncbi:hypothetical protein VE00_09779 [Pseudogymnoascus sp. WSF 3629]|nr:hypothetical protein VE00_09779 [Pseudogymnoascus sp. WSF 3629]